MKSLLALSFVILFSQNSFAGAACESLKGSAPVKVIRSKIYEASNTGLFAAITSGDWGGIRNSVINKCREDGFESCEVNVRTWYTESMGGTIYTQHASTYGGKRETIKVSKEEKCEQINQCMLELMSEKDDLNEGKLQLITKLLEINKC